MKILLIVVAGLLLLAGAFVVGYHVGHNQFMDALSRQVSGAAAVQLEALARIRTGDVEGGIELLERSLERAVVTIHPERLRRGERVPTTIGAAKHYWTAFPDEISPELEAVLAQIEAPPLEYCSPALNEVVALGLARQHEESVAPEVD